MTDRAWTSDEERERKRERRRGREIEGVGNKEYYLHDLIYIEKTVIDNKINAKSKATQNDSCYWRCSYYVNQNHWTYTQILWSTNENGWQAQIWCGGFSRYLLKCKVKRSQITLFCIFLRCLKYYQSITFHTAHVSKSKIKVDGKQR